jgi:hypothetical protein
VHHRSIEFHDSIFVRQPAVANTGVVRVVLNNIPRNNAVEGVAPERINSIAVTLQPVALAMHWPR